MRIGVVGAGLAGLCCAHALLGSGHDVAVFERDEGLTARRQGWRITVDEHGWSGLRTCLPADLFELVERTSGPPGGHFRITDERLRDAVVVSFDPATSQERQVDRTTLRMIAARGLGDRIEWGRAAVRITERDESVVLGFEDGSEEVLDFVVVADGVGSVLREAVLPDATPSTTGFGGIYGRVPLHDGTAMLMPDGLLDSGILAMLPPPGLAFFATTMRYRTSPDDVLAPTGRPDRAQSTVPEPRDYVMWGLVPPARATSTLMSRNGSALLDYARDAVAPAHRVLRRLVEQTVPEDVLFSRFSAGRITGRRAIGRAAVIGDAIHPMPPLGAHGGNTALRDAALLAERLAPRSTTSSIDLGRAVDSYHAEMTSYATEAIASAERQLLRLGRGGFSSWMLRKVLPLTRRRTVLVD